MSPIERRVTSAIVWLSLLCCVVLTGSGVFLMFFYTPESAKAYGDIESLHTDVAFGLLVRNLQRWFGMLLYPCLVFLLIAAFVGLVRRRQFRSWPVGALLSLLLLHLYIAHVVLVVPATLAALFVSRARRKRQPVE
jgi:quinol-cytochrome oxidoreductase complex cytochrome b subunit